MEKRFWEVTVALTIISAMFITWHLQKKYRKKCKSHRIRKIAHTTIDRLEHSVSELKKSFNSASSSEMEKELWNAVDSLKTSLDQFSTTIKNERSK